MNCPLCGDAMVPRTQEIRSGSGTIHRCEACDLEHLDGPSIDYGGEYRKTHGPVLGQPATPEDLFRAYRPYQQGRIDRLSKYLGPDKSLLEIGCSAGMFLDAVKPYVGSVWGWDDDEAAWEYAYQKIIRGLPSACWWDIVCAFQVLEHIEDPLEFLAPSYRMPNVAWPHAITISETHLTRNTPVGPGGIIAVEVPSLTDPLLTVFDCPEYRRFFYHEAHRWYFSPTSLAKLMDMAGFEGEIIYHQDYNFANALHWLHTGKPQPDCHAGLGTPLADQAIARMGWTGLSWAEVADAEYKALLACMRLTENITFIGRLK